MCEKIKAINAPVFSAKSGFYEDAFDLSIFTEEGSSVYYTVDGSIPDVHSIPYTEPIRIRYGGGRESRVTHVRNTHVNWRDSDGESHPNIATVIRAVAVSIDGTASDITSAVYFAGVVGYGDKMVISIVADPKELFGDDGIYVTGKEYDAWYLGKKTGAEPVPNFRRHGKEWERSAVLEIFQEAEYSQQPAGVRIHGGASREWKANKRLSVYARKRYGGSGWFDSAIFNHSRTHSFILRSGDLSGHIVWSGYMDGFIQNLVQDRKVAAARSREAVVCLNGARWYTAVLQEKYSKKYFQEKYGVAADHVIIAKEGRTHSGDAEDQALYDAVYHFLDTHDLSDQDAYRQFGQLIDIQSYIDFSCVNVYFGNLDYSEEKNNICWRTREIGKREYEDGRWRWALYDMDLENTGYGTAMEEINTFTTVGRYVGSAFNTRPMYAALKKNAGFCRQFVLSFMDMVNTDFTVKRARAVMDAWGKSMILGSKYLDWPETYFPVRTKAITGYLAQELGLEGRLEAVTLSVNDPEAGKVAINTITPALPDGIWSGRYFTDYPVTVSASENPGYVFSAWQLQSEEHLEEILGQTMITRKVPAGGMCIRAVFKQKAIETP